MPAMCLPFLRAVALLALAAALSAPAAGADLAFRKARFDYLAEKTPLRDILQAFCAAQEWSVAIGNVPDETISARFTMTPKLFWQVFTSSHNLQWYFDGKVVHVTPPAEMRTEFLPMTPEAFARFHAGLDRLEISDRRFPVRYDASSGSAVVAGPPRFVELALALHDQVNVDAASGGDFVIKVFSLRAGFAADRKLRIGGNDVTIPGVATLVGRLMSLDAPPAADPATPAAPDGAARLGPLSKLDANGQPRRASADGASGRPPEQAVGSRPPASARAGARPRVEADEASNSVIVRDRPGRMKDYAELIAALDRPRLLIEIEARMIEVERGALDELGIDWQARNHGSVVTADNTGSGLFQGANAGAPGLTTSPQYLSALVGDGLRSVFARVKAMESRGTARIVSSPRILTLDNAEALIENTETAYVKVSGNLEANLFSVVTGASLRIRPTLLGDGAPQRIRLQVTIEEGSFSGEKVDNVPIVQRSRVLTESELVDGSTLVVGGMSTEQSSAQNGQVPLLGRIPLLGALFSARHEDSSSRERIYLLTPRVVRAEAPPPDLAVTQPPRRTPAQLLLDTDVPGLPAGAAQ